LARDDPITTAGQFMGKRNAAGAFMEEALVRRSVLSWPGRANLVVHGSR
jgi:hypothetical protein